LHLKQQIVNLEAMFEYILRVTLKSRLEDVCLCTHPPIGPSVYCLPSYLIISHWKPRRFL